MRALVVGVLLTMGLAQTPLAADLPAACDLAKPPPKRGSNVKLDYGQFTDENVDYPYELLSLWDRHPAKSNELCLRYEIRSKSPTTIELLAWEDIGVHSVDVEGGKTASYKRPGVTRHNKAEVGDTELKAFKRASYTNRAFFTEESISRRLEQKAFNDSESLDTDFDKLITDLNYDATSSIPAAAKAFAEEGLTLQPSIQLASSDSDISYTELSTELDIGGGAKLRYSSEARYNDGVFHVTSTLVREGSAEAIFEPVGQALQKIGDQLYDERAAIFIPTLLKEFKSDPISFDGNKRTVSLVYKRPRANFALFIVTHPVTLQSGGKRACVTITSYSVYPFSVGRELCNSAQ